MKYSTKQNNKIRILSDYLTFTREMTFLKGDKFFFNRRFMKNHKFQRFRRELSRPSRRFWLTSTKIKIKIKNI